ncbi:hypothetical protein Naga_100792g1 [Nannochloropsis gaditana]|uniref:Uncharacterized protein n=1 Tax=Nannochloropsis gaditana TaxID=72520 RepID=W7TA57_9STRA|nr:hypothetical protein Naga_100792g1 [Nannochloropsis gaditana]
MQKVQDAGTGLSGLGNFCLYLGSASYVMSDSERGDGMEREFHLSICMKVLRTHHIWRRQSEIKRGRVTECGWRG